MSHTSVDLAVTTIARPRYPRFAASNSNPS